MYFHFVNEIKSVQDNSMSSSRLDNILRENSYDTDIMENFQIFKNQRNNAASLVLDSNPLNIRDKLLIYKAFIDYPGNMTPETASTIYPYIIKYRASKCFEILCRYTDVYLPIMATCLKYSFSRGIEYLLARINLFSTDRINGNEFFSLQKENMNKFYTKDRIYLLPFGESLSSDARKEIIANFRTKIDFDRIKNVIDSLINRQTSYITITTKMKKQLLYLLNLDVNTKLLIDSEIFDEIFYDTIYSYYLSNTNNRTILIKKISQI